MQRYPGQILAWCSEVIVGIFITHLLVNNPTPMNIVIFVIIILLLLGIHFRKNINIMYDRIRSQDKISELNEENSSLKDEIHKLEFALKYENEKINKAINSLTNKLPLDKDEDIHILQNVSARIEQLANQFSKDLDVAERMSTSQAERIQAAFATEKAEQEKEKIQSSTNY
ncbi:hypothetical protein ACEYW6_00205 [Nostoc sp. UIC 10607]|uniref:hypothetical protein n=1 Tax=Nostoc sp. UIC 10607 TaxID=3045935 RepID=UPI0039A0C876